MSARDRMKWNAPLGDLRAGLIVGECSEGIEASKPIAFFCRYIEVTPHSCLVWINDESDDGAVTTVTFQERGGKTLLVLHELYPSKEALDGAIDGMEGGMPEQFEQLDELLVALGASVGRS